MISAILFFIELIKPRNYNNIPFNNNNFNTCYQSHKTYTDSETGVRICKFSGGKSYLLYWTAKTKANEWTAYHDFDICTWHKLSFEWCDGELKCT